MHDLDKAVIVERSESVATNVLNRPGAHNALNWGLKDGLLHAVNPVTGDIAVRAVVLTGEGTWFWQFSSERTDFLRSLVQRPRSSGLGGLLETSCRSSARACAETRRHSRGRAYSRICRGQSGSQCGLDHAAPVQAFLAKECPVFEGR